MKLMCSTLVAAVERYPSLSSALSCIRDMGFGRVDLAAFSGWQNVDPAALAGNPAPAGEIAASAAAAGMEVAAINAHPGLVLNDPDESVFGEYRRRFAAVLQLAEKLGCGQITLQPGKQLAGQTPEAARTLLVRRLQELGAMAAKAGVQVSAEAHEGSLLQNPQDAQAVMKEVWPTAGLTYDPSHFVMQGIDLAQTAFLFEFTVHVHVRDAARGQMQVAWGEGCVDLDGLLALLRSHRYNGGIAIEYFGDFDPDGVSVRKLRERLLSLGVVGP